MEKYDAAFIECVKEKDLELFTILNDYHNFLLDENFIQDTSNWQLQHLREQLANGDISIDRGLFVEKMFDNGFEGWFYFKPDKRSLLANCLVGAKKDDKQNGLLIQSSLLVYENVFTFEMDSVLEKQGVVLEKNAIESEVYKYCLLYNLIPIK